MAMHMLRALPCLLTIVVAHRALALRCRCTTSKGVSECNGYFCDVHGTSDKRAACGAVRVARQTHFACVHIKHTSNDTFCHVIKSATACWCRDVDFCNVDLEAELFDVDEDEEEQEEPFDKESSEEEMPHDTFIITATRLDDMKTVELRTATRFDAIDHLQLTPGTKSIPPSISPDDYLDDYDDEMDGGDEEYHQTDIAGRRSTDSFPSGDQQETTTAPERQHQQADKIANEEQLAAVILKTATLVDYSTPPSATKFAVPLKAEAALPSLETSAPMLTASKTTRSTASAVSISTTTASTRTTTATIPSTTVTISTSTAETATPSTTVTSHPKTAVYRIPSTSISTTTTAATTAHPNTSSETESNELSADDATDENSLAEPRIAYIAVPIAIEKTGEGYDGTLNRRAKAPLTDGWEMIAPGTSAGSGRGAPSPTRIYAQSVPKTVLDKWARHHHYLNSASSRVPAPIHTISLCVLFFLGLFLLVS